MATTIRTPERPVRLNPEIAFSGSVPHCNRVQLSAFVLSVLAALRRFGELPKAISALTLAFVDDKAMRRLNHQFRRRNATTDVLTFPADASYLEPASKGLPLGDIVISLDQARRQAATEQHSLAVEVRYLILHGIIHALGYDHETDDGEMAALELRVRDAVGLL